MSGPTLKPRSQRLRRPRAKSWSRLGAVRAEQHCRSREWCSTEEGDISGLTCRRRCWKLPPRRLTSATDIKLPSWSFVQGDATMPPLPVVQSAADALFLSFTLELFDTPALPVVLASCLAAMKPGGRIVTVSMARSGGGLAVRLYEWMHAHYPRTVDCRPIDAAALLACAGFTLVSVEQRSLCGLPIEVVLVLAPG